MLDSERISIMAWQQAATDLGYKLSYEELLTCTGQSLSVYERNQKAIFGEDYPFNKAWEHKARHFDEYVARHGMPIKAGLLELLDLLDKKDIRKAVATSTKRIYTESRLKSAGLINRFNVIVTGSEVSEVKPAPDLFLEAARQLNSNPFHCVVIEDSPYGVQSAVSARMPVILVPDIIPLPEGISDHVIGIFQTLNEVRQFLLNEK